MIEITGTVEKRNMKEQLLDRMDLERERGITIKLQPICMQYKDYQLNLIDTPGHVDFSYEVSRSLAAVDGAVLLVDCTQGIQAQTLANLYLAMDLDLEIIPVVNKIDLPAADVEKTKKEIINLLGCKDSDIICSSGKTGQGVAEILDEVIKKIPPPKGNQNDSLRALIFDSNYDEYKGVVAYIRIFDGKIHKNDKIKLMSNNTFSEALEVGIFKPDYSPKNELKTGEIGYVITGYRNVSECRVGDTITLQKSQSTIPLQGYKDIKPMVFAGIFPREGNDFQALREAMEKIKLNDASLFYEYEQSQALGFARIRKIMKRRSC